MRFIRFFTHFILFSILFSVEAFPQIQTSSQNQKNERIAIRAARLLDVREGKLFNDAVILVEGEKITAAGIRLEIPPNTRVIDLGDSTLLPGLIDVHTHFTYHLDEAGKFGASAAPNPTIVLKYAAENLQLSLNAGFTTIRNLGAGDNIDILLRDAVKSGEIVGPRILVSGIPLTPNYLQGVNKKAERIKRVRQFVKERINEGVDVIKIFNEVDQNGEPVFSTTETRAAVEEANRASLKVAVHAHLAPAIKAAVEGGAASIEHGTFIDDDTLRLMVKQKTALVPTVYLPTHYFEHRKQFVFNDSVWNFFQMLKTQNFETVRKARRAGVWIVAGSDAVAGLHGNNAREIVWLTKAGMKPADAIRAATIDAAKLLDLEEQVGEIKAGKFADVIAVQGDPLRDISSVERVEFVMKSGKVIKSKL